MENVRYIFQAPTFKGIISTRTLVRCAARQQAGYNTDPPSLPCSRRRSDARKKNPLLTTLKRCYYIIIIIVWRATERWEAVRFLYRARMRWAVPVQQMDSFPSYYIIFLIPCRPLFTSPISLTFETLSGPSMSVWIAFAAAHFLKRTFIFGIIGAYTTLLFLLIALLPLRSVRAAPFTLPRTHCGHLARFGSSRSHQNPVNSCVVLCSGFPTFISMDWRAHCHIHPQLYFPLLRIMCFPFKETKLNRMDPNYLILCVCAALEQKNYINKIKYIVVYLYCAQGVTFPSTLTHTIIYM